MPKTVLIISTLDTKGPETLYLKQKLEAVGLGTIVMDLSMRGESPWTPDITPDRVAVAGGSSLSDVCAELPFPAEPVPGDQAGPFHPVGSLPAD